MVDDDAEVAQHLDHDAHVRDLGHVREAAALAGQGRRGEQLERGVLAAADGDLAAQRAAALDAEGLALDRRLLVLPVERPCVGHARYGRLRGPSR